MLSEFLRGSILRPIAGTAIKLAHWTAAHSRDSSGIMLIHCMDPRLNLRNAFKAYLIVPNALTPAGAIATSGDLSVEKRFEVAWGRFAMHDILIMGHENCAAMGQFAQVLTGAKNDPYYQNFLVSGKGFPLVDLTDFIQHHRVIVPNMTDNLAVLTALHTARNVLSCDIHDSQQLTTIADLIERGLVRVHIGYTGLKQVTERKWTETHYLLSPEGNEMIPSVNIARTIIAQRTNIPTLSELPQRIDIAEASFASRLIDGVAPVERLR